MASNKPIICVKTNDSREAVGVTKYLTQNALNGNFRDLLGYMANEEGDQYNSALESPQEKITARTINALLGSDDDKTRLYFIDSNNQRNQLDLESRVSDQIGSILNNASETVEGVATPYQRADLLYSREDTGGKVY